MPRGRRRTPSPTAGRQALRRLPGAAEDAERRRLRRPAARAAPHLPRAPGRARRLPQALPLHAGRRVPGHQRRPVSLAAAARAGQREEHLLRRRRRPVDLWLARRRGRQHPPLREGLSRRQGDPARAQLPLDRAHPRRRLAPHRPQREPARQDAVHRPRRRRAAKVIVSSSWDSEEEARAVGEEIEQLQRQGHIAQRDRHPRPRLVPDARLRRALRHPRPQLPRHRRPALLRAAGDPRRARLSPRRRAARRRPRLRAHRQRAEARHRRRHGQAPPRPRAGAARPADRRRRASWSRPTSSTARTAHRAPRPARRSSPAGAARSTHLPPHRARRDHPRRVRLHRDVAGRPLRRRARPAREPQGAGPLDGRVRDSGGFLEHVALVMDADTARPSRRRHAS